MIDTFSVAIWLWGTVIENQDVALCTLKIPRVEQEGDVTFLYFTNETLTSVREKHES